ncbi:MAG: response regulator [Pseudomonadota bacterium]
MTRILYVDDDADIREIAEMALCLEPSFEVRTCESGFDANEVARDWCPDLIMLDFMMPVLDGPGTLALLRTNVDLTDVPVIFITARTAERDVKTLMATGAAGVLAKPFNVMTLADECRQFLP